MFRFWTSGFRRLTSVATSYNILKQWHCFYFRTRNRGQGYVNCLTAAAETWSGLSSTGALTSDRSLRLPWTWMSLGSSGKSRSHQKRIDFRHKTFALKQLVAIIEKQSQQIHSGIKRLRLIMHS